MKRQTPEALAPLLGATEAEAHEAAAAADYFFRVSSRDGQPCLLTRDHRPHDRINVDLQGGKVVGAWFG